MVDSSTVALAAVGGLAAAEATGVTDLTGGGDDGGSGGGGGGVAPGLINALANAGGGVGVPNVDLSIPGTGGADATRVVEEVTRQVPTASDLDLDGSGGLPPLLDAGTGGGADAGGSAVDTSTSEAFDLQDLAGTGDVGTAIATAGEVGASTGSAVEGVVGTAADNPIATTGLAAGVAAAPFTGGASIPLALGAGGVAGQAATDAGAEPSAAGTALAASPLGMGVTAARSAIPDGPVLPDVSVDAPDVSLDAPDVSLDAPDVSIPDAPDVGQLVPTGGDGADLSSRPGRGPTNGSDGPERSEEKQERTKEDPNGGSLDLSGIGVGGGY
jgi:hypothetical protein